MATKIKTVTVDGEVTVNEATPVTFPEGVEPAFVRMGVTHTKSLGNYSSLKVECTVQVPCLKEEVEEETKRVLAHCAQTVKEATS